MLSSIWFFMYLISAGFRYFYTAMYAVVDIETTGGYPANNDITELAIVFHDGQTVTGQYSTLIRPRRAIPRYIQALTGITPEMVAEAPDFEELAPRIAELLKDRIFIAHHVNFDYTFIKHHLAAAGIEWNAQRLCTVRLSRKVFPGLPSYSLGNLCRHFGIPIVNRHRAGGDAEATAVLFEHLLRNNGLEHIRDFLKKGAKEQSLPPHLPKEQVEQLPYHPGVYYFHDQKDKVVYVGKAKNLKYRVRSHFTHNGAGKQRQEFLRNIHRISYQECATELMAFILESVEIKRLWPAFNNSQKRFTASYGLYSYTDQNGFIRLAIDKKRKNVPALYTFSLKTEGFQLLKQLMQEHGLCPKLCFVQTDEGDCTGMQEGYCKGACCQKEKPVRYNKRVEKALESLRHHLPSFAIVDEDKRNGGSSCVLMENGRFYGMGELPAGQPIHSLEQLKSLLRAYPENEYVRGLVYSFAEKEPEKVLQLGSNTKSKTKAKLITPE